MNKCKGIFGKLFGHKYQARYSEHLGPSEFHIGKSSGVLPSEFAIMAKEYRKETKTYIHDICVRCGDIKEVQNEN